MEKVVVVISLVLPVLAALVIGWFCKRKNIVSDEGIGSIKALVTRIFLPLIVFGALYKVTYDVDILICAGTVFIASLAGLLAGTLLEKLLKGRRPLLRFLTCGFEAGMIAIPLYTLLMGEENMGSFAMLYLGQELFVFTVYLALLNAQEKVSRREMLAGMAKNPILWGIALGILVGATGLGKFIAASAAGAVIDAAISFLTAPVACLILIVVGYQMELSARGLKGAAVSAALRLGLMALLCAGSILLIGTLMPMTEPLKWGCIILFITPPPYILPLYVHDESAQGEISTCLSLYTIVTVVLFAAAAAVAL